MHSPDTVQISDYLYIKKIMSGSRCGLWNLINHESHRDEMNTFFIKDSYKPNYKLLINKCQQAVETHLRDSNTSIKYLSNIRNFYKK